MTFRRVEYTLCARKSLGWLAERSNATVLKTADGATRPGVRIPHHPPQKLDTHLGVSFLSQMASGWTQQRQLLGSTSSRFWKR